MTPSPEKPFEPTKPRDEMLLPKGMTCADCGWFMRCEGLGVAKPENTKCDWAPSRFELSTKAQLSTLRSQLESANAKTEEWRQAAESIYASQPHALQLVKDIQALRTERDALKARVVAYEETKTYLVGYLTIHGSKDEAELIQFAFKQALAQLEGK